MKDGLEVQWCRSCGREMIDYTIYNGNIYCFRCYEEKAGRKHRDDWRGDSWKR